MDYNAVEGQLGSSPKRRISPDGWNRQTRCSQKALPKGVWVRIPLRVLMRLKHKQLSALSQVASTLNNIQLRDWKLPDRFGLHNKDTGEVEIICVLDDEGKYELELVNGSTLIEQHDKEIGSQPTKE